MEIRNRRRGAPRRVVAGAFAATFVLVAAACQFTASPAVTPASGGGGKPVIPGFTAFDPAVVGYEQSEVFLSGTATSYQPSAPLGTDGKFRVSAAATAPYTTRAVVMRPIDLARFHGTVIVEWLNVSGGADAGPDWMLAHNELIREGAVWVGVSAQKVGVDALKSSDPLRGDAVRYAGLDHPGDSFSYDIFSQAGQGIRDHADLILGGLQPKRLIAVGESQSAGRMVTYIDAVHPRAGVYDGFLVHSRTAGGAPLSQSPQANVGIPSPSPIRDDLDVPVLVFQTETDVSFSNLGARQPDTDKYRLWEVAGTSHFDYYGLVIGMTDTGDGQGGPAILASMLDPTNQPSSMFTCGQPINTGPAHYVLDAAFAALEGWVARGVQPPVAPRLQTTSSSPVTFVTDAAGNVKGGIRTPAVDVPVATLSGLGQDGSSFCFLFGTTHAFSSSDLHAIYQNHGNFVAAWRAATKSAQRAGFLVDADAKEIASAGVHSTIGN